MPISYILYENVELAFTHKLGYHMEHGDVLYR